MVDIKSIEGIMWAADILNGRREFPTYNKEIIQKSEDQDSDFKVIFENACEECSRKAAST